MKKKLIKLFFLVVVLFTVSSTALAQVYVTIRPPVPVIVRPPQPSRTHVWVNEEWEPNGNSYRYSGGHWDAPPRQGYYRRPGHWQSSRRGNMWIQGSWGRRNNKRH